mmetsp:Transcript_46757/g.100073  ORF Transcript_46757/g.100073 Transcript_46757/m.100073 type:complete len:377 (-) Transcript_46757:117-1247(-)|eukprot:CAMPEP_0206477340 /NCGR_PEP_ID=MMETSP0324_2-20121206/35300_1 /ASSEMBLY_ACC=CAM_ASM_000836 /TAXON_ID=2866 /ORGANISM="Crypthecodinium cohnii, Strain Seligo" /LENGTH=376 /DNA_ID=CAMNT_0053953237 /DNA_START=114 /DNA_END=1244 /DNA_ORIENTATION=+
MESEDTSKPQLVEGIGERLDLEAVERLRQRKAEESLLPPEVDAKQAALLGNGAKKVPRCGKCTRPLEEDAIEAKSLVCNRCKSGNWERPGVALEKKREAKRVRDAGSISAVKDDSLWEQPVCGGDRVVAHQEDGPPAEDDEDKQQDDDHPEAKDLKRKDSNTSEKERPHHERRDIFRCTVCTRPLKDDDPGERMQCVGCLEKTLAAEELEKKREQRWSSWSNSYGGGDWQSSRENDGWSSNQGRGSQWSKDEDDRGYGSSRAGKGGGKNKGSGNSWGGGGYSNDSWSDSKDWNDKKDWGHDSKSSWDDWKRGSDDWDSNNDWGNKDDWQDQKDQRGWNNDSSSGYKNDWNNDSDRNSRGKGGGNKGGKKGGQGGKW